MIRSVLIIFVFVSLAATCQKKDSGASNDQNPCDPGMMCTMEFRVLHLNVVDNDGTPVELDEYYTEFEDFRYTTERNEFQKKEGFYPVSDDGSMNKLSFTGEFGKFVGLKNGEKVVEQTLKIGKDCCHVLLMEGDKKLVVDLD